MATIFLDTCAINYLVKNGFQGNYVKKLLLDNGGMPIIGRNTLYECARNYKNREFCKEIFSFIKALNPEYTLTHTQFLQAEASKLKSNNSFAYWCSGAEKKLIEHQINCYKLGNNDSLEIKQYEERREREIKHIQAIWRPEFILKSFFSSRDKANIASSILAYTIYLFVDEDDNLKACIVHDKNDEPKFLPLTPDKLSSCSEIKNNLNKNKKLNKKQQDQVIKFLSSCGYSVISDADQSKLKGISFCDRQQPILNNPDTNTILQRLFNHAGILFSNEEISQFIQNLSSYPAMRTYFNSIIWLGDNARKERSSPSRDRILDAIQFIEASCSTTFVSEESKLIEPNKYGYMLNPDIELVSIQRLLQE